MTRDSSLYAVTYFYGDRWWCRVHRDPCQDAAKEERRDGNGSGLIESDVTSRRQLIEEAAADFIFANDHQPWTDYLDQVSFAPCLDSLPEQSTVGAR